MIAIDLDGTLEDSRSDMVAAVCRVRELLSLPARDRSALLPWMSRGMDNLYANCFDDFDDIEKVRTLYEADYVANVAVETVLYDGMGEALEEMKMIAPIVVVTNKPEHISRALLAALGVGEHITGIVGGDTCAENKPSIQMLEEAARRGGQPPVAMVGDSNGDIKMGNAFGIATVWCAWGYIEEPDLTPGYRVSTPSDLPATLRSIFGL